MVSIWHLVFKRALGDLRGHEGELVIDTTLDNFRVDNEAGGNVVLKELVIVSRESLAFTYSGE